MSADSWASAASQTSMMFEGASCSEKDIEIIIANRNIDDTPTTNESIHESTLSADSGYLDFVNIPTDDEISQNEIYDEIANVKEKKCLASRSSRITVAVSITGMLLITALVAGIIFQSIDKQLNSEDQDNMTSFGDTQFRGQGHMGVGAQLSLNQSSLLDKPPKLLWSHRGPGDYLNGINHVLFKYKDMTHDCLQITRDGRYLTSVQLSFTSTVLGRGPSRTKNSYITLIRFRNNTVAMIAKNVHTVRGEGQNGGKKPIQPVTMMRSDEFQNGDTICLTVSHPELLYVSQQDTFFGIVAL